MENNSKTLTSDEISEMLNNYDNTLSHYYDDTYHTKHHTMKIEELVELIGLDNLPSIMPWGVVTKIAEIDDAKFKLKLFKYDINEFKCKDGYSILDFYRETGKIANIELYEALNNIFVQSCYI